MSDPNAGLPLRYLRTPGARTSAETLRPESRVLAWGEAERAVDASTWARALSSRRYRHRDAGRMLDLGEMTSNAVATLLARKAQSDAVAVAQLETNFPDVGLTEMPYRGKLGDIGKGEHARRTEPWSR